MACSLSSAGNSIPVPVGFHLVRGTDNIQRETIFLTLNLQDRSRIAPLAHF